MKQSLSDQSEIFDQKKLAVSSISPASCIAAIKLSHGLQHGQLSDDDLLKHYANHPYQRLFIATRELEIHFKPFPDTLSDDENADQK